MKVDIIKPILAEKFKRTKIVATIGPATHSRQIIKELVAAGANCLRMNMSHDEQHVHGERIKWARLVQQELGKPVAILVDLQGPKIRIGELPPGGVELRPGVEVRFGHHAKYDETGIIPVQYDLSRKVKKGETIFLYDGRLQVVVKHIRDGIITGRVAVGGTLTSRKGINLPHTDFAGDIFTIKDASDLAFGVQNDADYIGLSFVQRASDIISLRKKLQRMGSNAQIIAKIETKLAVKNLEEIVQASDVLMVARGDLAIEIPSEQVPVVQQRIVLLGQKYQKPVIVATQMLASMTGSPQPTRAEVSDVATAVMQGADAVMLSEETTVGDYPVVTVATMKRIILETQDGYPPMTNQLLADDRNKPNAIASSAAILARQLGAKVIIAETTSGQTARNLSSFRPRMPIVMVTHDKRVYQQMALLWGGKSYYLKNFKLASEQVITVLKKAGNLNRGDTVLVASGHQSGVSGGTDTLRVQIVK
jgi:pyruvate kinase